MKKLLLLIFLCANTAFAQTLTNRQLFNFEPGDVFQWEHRDFYEFNCPHRELITYCQDSIISKVYSLNKDTIYYEIKNISYKPSHCDLKQPPLHTSKIERRWFTHLDSVVNYGFFSICPPLRDSEYVSDIYCNRKVRIRQNYNNKCFESRPWTTMAIEGCGVYLSYREPFLQYSNELTYYKKGTKSCGIYFPVGMTEDKLPDEIQLYPNPSSGEFQLITGNKQWLELNVFDVFGNQILKIKPDRVNLIINLNNQPRGIYFLRLTDKDKSTVLQKLVKQ